MDLFSPLSKDYCLYFYYLSVFGFVLFVFSIIAFGLPIIQKKTGYSFFLKSAMIALGYFIFYFQNRLLYSMCSGGTK
jgi:hypothetical protein